MNYRKLFALSSRATTIGWLNISQGTRTRIIEPIRYFLDNEIALNRIKKHQVCFIPTKILTNVPFVHWNLVVRGLARISRRGMFPGSHIWKLEPITLSTPWCSAWLIGYTPASSSSVVLWSPTCSSFCSPSAFKQTFMRQRCWSSLSSAERIGAQREGASSEKKKIARKSHGRLESEIVPFYIFCKQA